MNDARSAASSLHREPACSPREVLARRVYRTGVQTVERADGRYYLTLRNRTVDVEHEVPIETARRYYARMRLDSRGAGV